MYLTPTPRERITARRRTSQPAITERTRTNPRASTTRPEPLIDAWARRAMSANGFGG